MSNPEIPKVQQAAVLSSIGSVPEIVHDHPVPDISTLQPGQCLIKIECTGVCASDLSIRRGDWPIKPKLPLVGGHEGVGRVIAIAPGTVDSPVSVGQRVGIKWLATTCLHCEVCGTENESLCQNIKQSGYAIDGTFSQYTVSYTNYVTPIPDGISSQDACTIMCAGLTVYSALKKSNTKPGDWVAIPGAGGGLGHLAIQYAVALGLRVIAIDTGDEKRQLAEKLGAEKWIDFAQTDNLVQSVAAASGGLGPHAAIVTASKAVAYGQAFGYLRPAGTLVAVGLPPTANGNLEANILLLVIKGTKIVGSNVGNRQEAIEALQYAVDGKVKCNYEVRKLADLPHIYESMEKGQVTGRIVIDMRI
ncbi:GroES-like protein [Sistotremastrum niveocremeum HHB9708]|uniref:alcohol dehydrogenase n=1 Tax=Sistotremastrum niveocremeum HHB9708 TaxID=1314777 RepID=A0A164QLX6_9AGAM|nr:GroES-like protein [Sistotremastrum niveocremeum HHB9708]